jgi:hypothetical protein
MTMGVVRWSVYRENPLKLTVKIRYDSETIFEIDRENP